MKSAKTANKKKKRRPAARSFDVFKWTVTISDGYCTHAFDIEENVGMCCIADLAKACVNRLKERYCDGVAEIKKIEFIGSGNVRAIKQ